MNKSFSFRFTQSGATMIEAMAAMVIMGIMLAAGLQMKVNDARDGTADNAAVMSIRVQNAIKSYRVETGSWPSNTGQLVSTGKLTSAEALSPFGTGYSFTTSGTNLVVTVNANSAVYARRLAGLLPGGTASGNSFSYRIQPPGSEASLAGLYSLDGSKELAGNMNAANYSINNVSTLNAAQVNGTNITASNVVNTNHLTATGNVRGGYVESSGNMYVANQLSAGNQIVAANNIASNGTINATGQIYGGSLRAAGNVNGQNLIASGAVSGQTVYAATSITTDGQLRAGQILSTGNIQSQGDISASNLYTGGYSYARRFVDYDDSSYSIDPNGQSRVSSLEVSNEIRLSGVRNSNSSCTANSVAFDPSGNLLTCKSGLFQIAITSQEVTHSGEIASFREGKLGIVTGKVGYIPRNGSVRVSLPFPVGYWARCVASFSDYSKGFLDTNWTSGCDVNSDRASINVYNADEKDPAIAWFQVIDISQ